MHTFLQGFVFLMGLACIAMALRYLVFFVRSRRSVGRSMVWMLTEQTVSSSCTLIFSAHSLWGTLTGQPEADWNAISTNAAIILRLIMFGVMLHSTRHLSKSVKRILETSDDESRG